LRFKIETERETDGHWIAEISELPGVLAYGKTEAEANAKTYTLALRRIRLTGPAATNYPDIFAMF
jgi:hypothetical protein